MFVYEDDKLNKLINDIMQFFCIVRVKPNEIIIPNLENANQKTINKIAKKVVNKLESKKIILSKNLKDQEIFKNYLYSKNIEIADGKFLFKILAEDVLEYITLKSKLKQQDLKIAILVNDIDRIAIKNIKIIASKYKNTTIVTRRINRLKKLQKDLYEEKGIILTITNNRKKALSKTKIILNFDFPEELVNKFYIYEKAIIVNFEEKIKILAKRFNGINISDYEIKMNQNKLKELVGYEEQLIQINSVNDIYESSMYKEQSYESLKRNIKEDRYKNKMFIRKSYKILKL